MPLRRHLLALLTPTAGAAAVIVPVAQAHWARHRGPQVDGAPSGVTGTVGDGPVRYRVVWLGDSLAAGVGADRAEETMAHLVARHLTVHHLPGGTVAVDVLAVPGATVGDVVTDQLPRLAALGAVDLVVLFAGANDVARRTRLRQLGAGYTSILDTLSGTPVLVAGIPHLRDARRLPQPLRGIAGVQSRRVDRVLRAAAGARPQVTVVDVAGCSKGVPRSLRDSYLARDRYHPSAAGYRLWAEALVAALPTITPTLITALTPAARPAGT